MKNLQAESQQYSKLIMIPHFWFSNDLNSPFSTVMASLSFLNGSHAPYPYLTLWCCPLAAVSFLFPITPHPHLACTFLWFTFPLLLFFWCESLVWNSGISFLFSLLVFLLSLFLPLLYFPYPFRQGLRGWNLTSGLLGSILGCRIHLSLSSTISHLVDILLQSHIHTHTHTHTLLIPATLFFTTD